jgi:hypothetical protein
LSSRGYHFSGAGFAKEFSVSRRILGTSRSENPARKLQTTRSARDLLG